eukprot:GFUD01128336.1.p1 GENE.GFUD01128336.1~~GFUD01128336.1.p1  ORF type:complete len:115 (+),score=32.52 GFUD01128336.1:47-346(+)
MRLEKKLQQEVEVCFPDEIFGYASDYGHVNSEVDTDGSVMNMNNEQLSNLGKSVEDDCGDDQAELGNFPVYAPSKLKMTSCRANMPKINVVLKTKCAKN